jgi:hypothetical protein
MLLSAIIVLHPLASQIQIDIDVPNFDKMFGENNVTKRSNNAPRSKHFALTPIHKHKLHTGIDPYSHSPRPSSRT